MSKILIELGSLFRVIQFGICHVSNKMYFVCVRCRLLISYLIWLKLLLKINIRIALQLPVVYNNKHSQY
jgi:hypothetical protein